MGYITQKLNVGDISLDLAFPERNTQVNENAEENYKRQYISELNEQYITGFATPQGNLEILKEPAFERFFTVSNPDQIDTFASL